MDSTARSPPETLRFVLRYLGTSQARLDGFAACPTISVYLAAYLLYSTKIEQSSLVEYIHLGCQDYLHCIETGIHKGAYEHVTGPLLRHHGINEIMVLDNDLDTSGFMLASPELYNQIPGEFARPEYCLVKGIRPAFERIVQTVMQVKEEPPALEDQPIRSFAFARNGKCISGSCRRLPGGKGVRFDFIDSHDVLFREYPPPTNQSSAVWITCDSLNEAVAAIERLFPPATDISDLVEVKSNTDYQTLRPKSSYSLTVFRKEYTTPEEAQLAARDAIASGQPAYSCYNKKVVPVIGLTAV